MPVFETVGGSDWPLDADLYFKDRNGGLWVGYQSAKGRGKLWETPRGLTVEVDEEKLSASGGNTLLGRYDLYVDVGGLYVTAPSGKNEFYRLRSDGRPELVSETRTGSKGRAVKNVRGKVSKKRKIPS